MTSPSMAPEPRLLFLTSTDSVVRKAAKVDTHRVGYVAFTRPRELLSIACLQPLDGPTNELLGNLGVSLTE